MDYPLAYAHRTHLIDAVRERYAVETEDRRLKAEDDAALALSDTVGASHPLEADHWQTLPSRWDY